eukprot:scaffold35011_cov57-Phaeocystis_antarctica.AAC.4
MSGSLDGALWSGHETGAGPAIDSTLSRGTLVLPSASTALAEPPPPLSTEGSVPLTSPCDDGGSALRLHPRVGTLSFGGEVRLASRTKVWNA